MRIGLVTSAALADLTGDDRLLLDQLTVGGVIAEPAVWDDPAVDWGAFDACLLRSTWDYVERYQQFVDWLEVVASNTRLFNPLDLIRWNLSKRYLDDLSGAGFPIVPTEFVEAGGSCNVTQLVRDRGWAELVVKPDVGATSSGAGRFNATELDAAQGHLDSLLATGGALVQQFQTSVLSHGELSAIYFAGEPSHAVRKKAAVGDYRVNVEFGGSTTVESPSPAESELARRIVKHVGNPLYARVDLIPTSSGPAISELELAEPELFFRFAPESAESFAKLVAATVRSGL